MQLDLLNWSPPCSVLVFPAEKQVGRIRHVASVLLMKRDKAAKTYWRKTVRSMGFHMQRANIPDEVIDAELRSFFDAVEVEMSRQAHGKHAGGAA